MIEDSTISAAGSSRREGESGRDRARAGREIGGCRLERLLGEGGMGAVWLAHHVALDKPVVVKLMHAGVAGTPGYVVVYRGACVGSSALAPIRAPGLAHLHARLLAWRGTLAIAREDGEVAVGGRALAADDVAPLTPGAEVRRGDVVVHARPATTAEMVQS